MARKLCTLLSFVFIAALILSACATPTAAPAATTEAPVATTEAPAAITVVPANAIATNLSWNWKP